MSEPTTDEISKLLDALPNAEGRDFDRILYAILNRQQAAIEALQSALADFRQDPFGPRYGSAQGSDQQTSKPAQPAAASCREAFVEWMNPDDERDTHASLGQAWNAAWNASAAAERARCIAWLRANNAVILAHQLEEESKP